jgi:hypothetical protein
MRIPLWLHREWAIFLCANGAHVHCPHASDSPYFNLRTTRRQARKAAKMIDTQPCITEGEHIRSQRHATVECPVPTGDASVRYLLVELPIDSQLDVETVHDQAQRDLAAWLATDADLVDTPAVTQVYPGDVVSPDAVPDEQPDAVVVVEDPAPAALSEHVSPAYHVAADLLVAALSALNAYRDHAAANALGRHGMNDLHLLDELADRSDLITTPRHAVAALLAEGGRIPMDENDTSEGQWWSDVVADLAAEHGLLQD